jgi:hypothetical protein
MPGFAGKDGDLAHPGAREANPGRVVTPLGRQHRPTDTVSARFSTHFCTRMPNPREAIWQHMVSPPLRAWPATGRDSQTRVKQPGDGKRTTRQWQSAAFQRKTSVSPASRRSSLATLGLTVLLLIGSNSLLAAQLWKFLRQSE